MLLSQVVTDIISVIGAQCSFLNKEGKIVNLPVENSYGVQSVSEKDEMIDVVERSCFLGG